jgi:hypothetical protein
MTNVTIYEQECFGQTHFRTVRDDGWLLFGRHQTDFPSQEEALSAVLGEFRREKLGPVKVYLVPLERQSRSRIGRRVVLHEGEAA